MDPQEPKDFDSSQHYTKLKDKLIALGLKVMPGDGAFYNARE